MKTVKLNFVKQLGFLAAAAVFILSACQKKDANLNTTPAAAPSYANRGIPDDAANGDNPYDYVGLAHNESLHATRSVWTNSRSTLSDVSTAVTAYVQQTYDPNAVPASNASIQRSFDAIQADMPNLGRNIIANSSLSGAGKDFANQMIQALYNARSGSTYFDIKNAVMGIENQILNSPSLPASDREALLKMASVGRYSLLYWINEVNGSNTGSSLLRTVSVTGSIPAQMYRTIVVVSGTDYMSSTTVIVTRDYIYVETVTIFSAYIAVYYF